MSEKSLFNTSGTPQTSSASNIIWTTAEALDYDKRLKNIETREEDNFTQIMLLKERVRKLDRWLNMFIVVNLVIAALYLIT